MAQSLTEKQELFINEVLQGVRPSAAARLAGYAHSNVAACTLMDNPRIKEALRKRRQAALDGDIATLALQTVREIIGGVEEIDEDTGEIRRVQIAPASVRWPASKWVLEQTGHSSGVDDSTARKDLTEMSADELAEVVNGGMQALGELATQLQGHHIVEDQPRQVRDLNAVPEHEGDEESLLD